MQKYCTKAITTHNDIQSCAKSIFMITCISLLIGYAQSCRNGIAKSDYQFLQAFLQ